MNIKQLQTDDLDAILAHLQAGKHLDEKCASLLLIKIMEVLYEEPTLLSLQAPIIVCGDIHGQLFDLFELFDTGGDPGENQYLFMGDYVDRGYYSLETFLYLVTLKLKFPKHIWLLRGNHEDREVNKAYGFYEECMKNYGHAGLWNLCQETFDLLPMCALINKKVFATHGGLSPKLPLIEQIPLIERQKNLGTQGVFSDLAWGDPDPTISGWGVSKRGAGWLFGSNPTNIFCQNNKIDLITRAHELVMQGYQYNFSEKVLTVWSAPNYCYVSHNIASVLKLDANLNRELKIFNERPADKRKKPDDYVPRYFT